MTMIPLTLMKYVAVCLTSVFPFTLSNSVSLVELGGVLHLCTFLSLIFNVNQAFIYSAIYDLLSK